MAKVTILGVDEIGQKARVHYRVDSDEVDVNGGPVSNEDFVDVPIDDDLTDAVIRAIKDKENPRVEAMRARSIMATLPEVFEV